MSMEMPKDIAVLDPRVAESRAEVLLAMDTLMKHLNYEDAIESWIAYGVPDGAPPLRMTQDQMEYYGQFVDDFENITKVFATIVRRTFFKTTYKPRGFC